MSQSLTPGSVLAALQVAHQLRERQEGPRLAGLLLHGAAVRQRLPADPGAAPVLPHLLRQRHAHQDGCHWGRVPEGGGWPTVEPAGLGGLGRVASQAQLAEQWHEGGLNGCGLAGGDHQA